MGKRRVVITGIGVIAPNGIGKERFWENIKNGKSGVKKLTLFETKDFPCKIAGEVTAFDPSDFFNTKDIRHMARFTQFSVVASKMAIEDSALNLENENREKIGVVIGSSVGGLSYALEEIDIFEKKGLRQVSPYTISASNSASCSSEVSIAFGLKGPALTISTTSASGTDALGIALNMIRNNEIDIAVAGGTDCPIIKNILAGFCATRIASIKRNDEPEKASRPFDKGRDGVILSEGAGILILEELKHALARKANIYGEICGYGRTSDAYHSFMPSPDQTQFLRAINLALADANLKNERVDYISAWGLSRDIPDICETNAIKKIFGKRAYKIPISAITSMIGQSLGATGPINCIASLLALKEQLLPPTINQEYKDSECDLDYVPNVARKAKINNFLLYSFVFGGRNSALVVRKI